MCTYCIGTYVYLDANYMYIYNTYCCASQTRRCNWAQDRSGGIEFALPCFVSKSSRLDIKVWYV